MHTYTLTQTNTVYGDTYTLTQTLCTEKKICALNKKHLNHFVALTFDYKVMQRFKFMCIQSTNSHNIYLSKLQSDLNWFMFSWVVLLFFFYSKPLKET